MLSLLLEEGLVSEARAVERETVGDFVVAALVEALNGKVSTFLEVFTSILVQYDQAQAKKRGYNPNALYHYLNAIDRIKQQVSSVLGDDSKEAAAKLRDAIDAGFTDGNPGDKLRKVVTAYIEKGTLPKVPISKEVKAQIAAEKAAAKAAKAAGQQATPMAQAAEALLDSSAILITEARLDEASFYRDGDNVFVDTAFINAIGKAMPGMELRHLGMGEFELSGSDGTIDFDRMRGKDFPGQSGRSHKLYDDKGGKLIKKLLDAMKDKAKEAQAESAPVVAEPLEELGGGGRRSYGGDPRWMEAKYAGTTKDGTAFRKGDKVLYFPATKSFYVGAQAEKEWRDFLSAKGGEEGMPYAEAAEKKLKGKKLDAAISGFFNQHGRNIQFDIFDLGKIAKAGRDAYETGGLEAAEKAVIDAIAKYRKTESLSEAIESALGND